MKNANSMEHKQVVYGEYVFTPCQNAFNNKVSYWISKDGYMVAFYAFTPMDKNDLKDWLKEDSLKSLAAHFEERLARMNTGGK